MSDSMLRVTSDVRDRLAELARDRGTTIGAIVREFAESTPTKKEMEAKAAEAKQILHELSGYDPTEEEERAARAELQRRIEAIQ
jgi:predicted DNA-binding protein